jgi:hypothetical protein
MLGLNQQRVALLLDAAHHAAQPPNCLEAPHAIHTSLVSGTYQSFRAASSKLARTVLYRSPSTLNAQTESSTFYFYLITLRRTAMTTLMIKDLSLTEELDRTAMAAVHGGRLGLLGIYSDYDVSNTFKSRIDASQFVGQSQSFDTAVGNNVALVDKFKPTVDVHGTQRASNNINVGGSPYGIL